MSDVALLIRNEANTSGSTQIPKKRPRVQIVPNDLGKVIFEVDNRDLPISGLTRNTIVQATLGGEPIYPYRIDTVRPTVVNKGEEKRETTTFEGPSIMRDWQKSLVHEAIGPFDQDLASTVPVLDERVFGWMGPDYDSSSWDTASIIAVQGWPSTFYKGLPSGWMDGAALWIGPSSGSSTNADEGLNLFHEWVLLGVGSYRLQWAGDNWADAYLNGKSLGRAEFRQGRSYDFEVVAEGWVLLAFRLINAPDDGAPGGNPTALVYTLGTGADYLTNVTRSGDHTKILEYPSSEPEIPIGRQIRACMRANDLLEDVWTVGGTDTADQGGNTFTPTGVMSYRIGKDSLFDVLVQNSQATIDFGPGINGKTLYPYKKGVLTTTSTLDLVTGYSSAGTSTSVVNVTDLKWALPPPTCTKLRVRYGRGRFTVGTGDEWDSLDLDQIDDFQTALDYATGLMALYGQSFASASFGFSPSSSDEWPFTAFDHWSILNVPADDDHDEFVPEPVAGVTITENELGRAVFSIETGSLLQTKATLLERASRRSLGAGALGGRATASVPALSLPARTATPTQSEVKVWESYAGASLADMVDVVSDIANPPAPGVVQTLRICAGDVSGASGDTEVEIFRNGSSWFTMVLPSGHTAGQYAVQAVGQVWTPNDQIQCVPRVDGGHLAVNIQATVSELAR